MALDPKYLILLAALVWAVAGLAGAPSAGAATSCQFDDPSDTVNVQVTADGDLAEIAVGVGGTIEVWRATGFVSCTGGTPTTTTVDTVNVFDNSGAGSTQVRLSEPAEFGPGKTQEQGSDQFSEIEFNVLMGAGNSDRLTVTGSDTADDWRVGKGGFDFNAPSGDPTPDSETGLLSGIEFYELSGHGGNDQISAQGGAGTGSPFQSFGVKLDGGAGNDTLEGANGLTDRPPDQIDGGQDDDVLRGFGGEDVLNGNPGVNSYDGGPDTDTVSYQTPVSPTGVTVDLGNAGAQNTGVGTDTFVAVENVVGNIGPDRLTGDGGANVLRGLDGDDMVDGRGGADEVSGGPGGNDGADTVAGGAGDDQILGGGGVNTLTFADSPSGVTADLTAGTATGEGTDTLSGFQNLIGSSSADTLTGSAEANAITGGAGADTISALAGADTVAIRDGEADTASCGTEIDTATADQASLDTVDADCETTSFLPEPDQGGGQQGGDGADTEVSFDLSGKSKQRVLERKAVVVTASCPQEDCTVAFGGRVKPATESLAAGVAERVKLKLKRKHVRKVEAALDDDRKPRIAVTGEATDGAGNATSDSVTVRAKR